MRTRDGRQKLHWSYLALVGVLALWAITVLVQSRELLAGGADDAMVAAADIGPGAIPFGLAALILVLIAADILLTRRRDDSGRSEPAMAETDIAARADTRRVVQLVLGLVIATALTFLVSALAAVAVLAFWSARVVDRQRPRTAVISTVAITAIFFVIFSELLNIRLPLIGT